ncbi:MAG: NUDIX domain-containing protein [Piscinibacter sp.]|nr:NUDIX domain-containing protein [Piscinibacter sp.]
MTADWRARLDARAAAPPLRERRPLRLAAGGAEIGSVESALGRRLVAAGLPVAEDAGGFAVDGDPDASLASLARWLHAQGLAGRWRDELLSVTDASGIVHAAIERAAVRPLGITTHAVHLAGRQAGGRWWLQQRALDKATDPGLWDTLMGGLVADRESLAQTLERETWEEAGLRVADLQGLVRHGDLLVRRPVSEGYMVERIAVFEAVVPAPLQPVNQDGEVLRFELVDTATLQRRLADDAFTLEAALVLLQVLDGAAR